MNKALDLKGERKQNGKEGKKQEQEEWTRWKWQQSGEDGRDEGMNVFLR